MKMVVNIDVPELSQAIAFYCSAWGLDHNRTLDDVVAELTGASSVVYLLQKPPDSNATDTASEIR